MRTRILRLCIYLARWAHQRELFAVSILKHQRAAALHDFTQCRKGRKCLFLSIIARTSVSPSVSLYLGGSNTCIDTYQGPLHASRRREAKTAPCRFDSRRVRRLLLGCAQEMSPLGCSLEWQRSLQSISLACARLFESEVCQFL